MWNLYEQILLALMMWREARSDGREGMRAVGHVAWNRHVQEKRPLHRVITDDAQFTSINPPGKSYDPQLDVWPRLPDARFDEALALAEAIVSGTDIDPTNGGLFYWNPGASTKGGWFDRNIAPQDTPLQPHPGYEVSRVAGQHVFYRVSDAAA